MHYGGVSDQLQIVLAVRRIADVNVAGQVSRRPLFVRISGSHEWVSGLSVGVNVEEWCVPIIAAWQASSPVKWLPCILPSGAVPKLKICVGRRAEVAWLQYAWHVVMDVISGHELTHKLFADAKELGIGSAEIEDDTGSLFETLL
ncbi:hypothetical protein [Mesorhizobium sp. P5_C1]